MRGQTPRGGSRRPSVLILVQNLPVPLDRRVWQEAQALKDAGYDVHVVCPRTRLHPKRREQLGGVRIYRYRPGPEARRALSYLVEYAIDITAMTLRALTIRATRRIDIVHICNPPDLLFLPAFPLKVFGAKVIFDQHDACPELMEAKGHSSDAITTRTTRRLERLTYRVADVVVSPNESYRSIALSRGQKQPEDVFVVRSGPDAYRFADAAPDQRWRNGREFLVGYVGVMGIQDGLDYLVDAAAIIVNECGRDDIQFVCVGRGPELDRLRSRVEALGLADHVSFPGRLPDAELTEVLATADVCVNPDEANTMNDISTMNKIMEYMALGKPIVQFDVHEGRVSAGKASLYAERNDSKSLAKCILELVDDENLRLRLGRLGRERFSTHLTWERQVPHLLAAYQRVLENA